MATAICKLVTPLWIPQAHGSPPQARSCTAVPETAGHCWTRMVPTVQPWRRHLRLELDAEDAPCTCGGGSVSLQSLPVLKSLPSFHWAMGMWEGRLGSSLPMGALAPQPGAMLPCSVFVCSQPWVTPAIIGAPWGRAARCAPCPQRRDSLPNSGMAPDSLSES